MWPDADCIGIQSFLENSILFLAAILSKVSFEISEISAPESTKAYVFFPPKCSQHIGVSGLTITLAIWGPFVKFDVEGPSFFNFLPPAVPLPEEFNYPAPYRFCRCVQCGHTGYRRAVHLTSMCIAWRPIPCRDAAAEPLPARCQALTVVCMSPVSAVSLRLAVERLGTVWPGLPGSAAAAFDTDLMGGGASDFVTCFALVTPGDSRGPAVWIIFVGSPEFGPVVLSPHLFVG